jgi:hypothetical protein
MMPVLARNINNKRRAGTTPHLFEQTALASNADGMARSYAAALARSA